MTRGLARPRALVLGALLAIGVAVAAGEHHRLPPFLDAFKQNSFSATASRMVTFPSALGPVHSFLARPDTKERLPAVLLVHDQPGLSAWMKQNARDLSGIGYVVLAPDLSRDVPADGEGLREDERVLAKLSAALRWLRRQDDVMPGRIGVVGWSWGAAQALALAASARVQACVLCCGPIPERPALLHGLQQTPCLWLADAKRAAALDRVLAKSGTSHKVVRFNGVSPGFMGPPGTKAYVERAAEDAWVEMYEFLGKHVEDADINPPVRLDVKRKGFATIADIMRAANSPAGVRGALIRAVAQPPADEKGWQQIRADAALLADAAGLLNDLSPPRGPRRSWHEQVRAFQQTAAGIIKAAEQHDLTAARRGLEKLGGQCAGCHKRHR